jgi:hypothetical protein
MGRDSPDNQWGTPQTLTTNFSKGGNLCVMQEENGPGRDLRYAAQVRRRLFLVAVPRLSRPPFSGTEENQATQCNTFRTTDQRGSADPGMLPSTQ